MAGTQRLSPALKIALVYLAFAVIWIIVARIAW